MKSTRRNSFAIAIWTGAFATVLFGLPALSAAQESPVGQITVVTDLYKFEDLLPGKSPVELETVKDIASWCLDMAGRYRARLSDARDRVDLQREAKRAEIKALEARAKSAAKSQDEVLKKQLDQELRNQRAELDILDAVKELAVQENAAAGDFEAAGKSLRSLAEAYRDLADNRERAVRQFERAVEEAAQAGLEKPLAPGPDFPVNDRASKVLSEAGKNVNDLGERMMKLGKARQGLVIAYEKLEKAKTGGR